MTLKCENSILKEAGRKSWKGRLSMLVGSRGAGHVRKNLMGFVNSSSFRHLKIYCLDMKEGHYITIHMFLLKFKQYIQGFGAGPFC